MSVARAVSLGTCLLVLLNAPAGATAATPAEFQNWFRAAADGLLEIPGQVEHQARRFRYVFVGGFASERMTGYFSQSEKELRAFGVPADAIETIFPSSHELYEGNSGEVRARFLEIASKGPEPLVVIAHSRGACDALAFALRDESFVRDRVHALFLVQGAFGGTGAADYLMGEGSLMDRRMPLRLRVLAYALGRVERFLLGRGKHGGLPGLTLAESGRFWDRLTREHASAIPIVGPKTFYVTSEVNPARLRFFHRAIATYLQTYYGPNDGMVALRDQALPGLGTRLCVLDAAHTDLTHRFPATRAPRRLRRALIQSILMAVADPSADPATAPPARVHRVHRRVR